MNNYSIINIDDQLYNRKRIMFASGKQCDFFWNKNSYIKEVIVSKTFNGNLKDGQIFLYLKNINDFKDIQEMIRVFSVYLYNAGIDVRKVNFKVIINNDKEREQILDISNKFGIDPQFVLGQNYNSKLNDNIEDFNKEIMASGNSKEIIKEDNGIIKHYVVNDGKVYNDNDSLSLAEQKKILLESWMKDPVKSRRISQLSNLELDDLLMENVTGNKKEYYMEQSNDMVDVDKKAEMTKNQISLNDGKGNAELGIIENAPNKENQYSTIEENNDKYRVVTPEVSNSVVSGSNSGSSISSDSISANSYSFEISNQEEQLRNMDDTVYYVDDDYKIYDAIGNEIGMVGRNGYLVDYTNNCLTKDGKPLGYIGDINSMSNAKDKNKPMVKTLRKEERSAAFVSFPVILLVFSLVLLGGAIILYFMS